MRRMQDLAIALDAPPAAAAPGGGWTYTVSVRSLCEFTAKQGDLDRRFTPSATALEGLNGQLTVASRRGPDYETEVALSGVSGPLRVRGRADGFDPSRLCLEEVKTIRGQPDAIPANRRLLHWAQLQTYGALFCRERGLDAVTLALVYFDVVTQTETELRELCAAADLEAAFAERCALFLDWARSEALHRARRDVALHRLAFPPGEFRPGQRLLAEAVYRAAARGGTLLAQAPTGIGKTLGTLFPMLRAMPNQAIDKVAFLTCKGTGRLTAVDALARLREGTPGHALRVLVIVAKDAACEHPDKACHADSCPLARGFYDRLPAARAAAVAEGWLDAQAQRRIALAHGLCPYYLGQELLRWADVMVGDVHHAFDANGQLWGLAQSLGWRMAWLVDEAHNLVERARRMYSADLPLDAVHAARDGAPAHLRGRFDAVVRSASDTLTPAGLAAAAAQGRVPDAAPDAPEGLETPETPEAPEAPGRQAPATDAAYTVLTRLPDDLAQALQALNAGLGEHFQTRPQAVGPLLNFHFDLTRFLRLLDGLGEHSLLELRRGDAADAGDAAPAAGDDSAPRGTVFGIRNIVPARYLRPRFQSVHSSTLFSATLGPPSYPQDLLGLPEDTAWIDVPPVFPAEHLTVRVADRVSTRFPHRARSLDALTAVMAAQFDAQPGNYLAFFSSFAYLQQTADRLAAARPDLPQWRQARAMRPEARHDFLARFSPGGRGIGFAVLGGVFAEGVDLPGTRLIGAFIATLGLPPVSPLQDHLRARLDAMFGADHGYADLVPAMQKVVQAAGRVLRTPEDRGWLWLLDDRYRRPEVVCLLPPWWGLAAAPG